METIDHSRPERYLVENAQTGVLKDQGFMAALPYKDVDKCKYGLSYRKRARLWGCLERWPPLACCVRTTVAP